MADSQVEEIKNRLNVLDVVGAYVKLSKTGVNYRGICPFHSEKGPSFFVSPSRQMWKCFGCGKGGDIFEFIKEIEGVEFGDALKILANKAGIELKRENPKLRTERQRLYEICNLGCSFFEKQLEASAWGKQAKEYLLKRGITEESLKKWRIGYSPDTWQSLSDFLVGKGYTRDEIVNAGLAVKSDKGNNPYDRFRGRIIFPIFDLNSQPIGFGARIFKDAQKKETAKYINTPQTLLYDKSNVLYGLNNAKVPVRKNNQCVLTEGYTDTIMAHQAGFDNTVSVSGTALTSQHLNLLKRYTDNLLLAFDMDLAGSSATTRGIDLAICLKFNIKVIDTYANAKDPAEIILENQREWEISLKNAKDIMDFYFSFILSRFDKNDSKGRNEIEKFLFPKFDTLPSQTEQNKQRQRLAEEFKVSEDAILEDFKNWKKDNQAGGIEKSLRYVVKNISPNQHLITGRKKLLEDKIVALVINYPENLNLIEEVHRNLFNDKTKQFLDELRLGMADKAVFASILEKPDYKDFYNTLALKAEVDYEEDPSAGSGQVAEEIQLCLSELKGIELRNSLNNMLSEIRSEKDEHKRDEIIKEFDKKARELHHQA
jgi:DNA primase